MDNYDIGYISLHSVIDEKYDKLTVKLRELLFDKNYTLHNTDSEKKLMTIYQKNESTMEIKYELLGMYNYNNNIFTWAWGLEVYDRDLIDRGKNIKDYRKKIEKYIANKSYHDVEYLEKIFYYLSNDIFFMDPVNIPILEKFSVSVTETNGIVERAFNNDQISSSICIYYLVTDILKT